MKLLGFNFSAGKSPENKITQNSPTKARQNPAIVKIIQNFKDSSRKDIDKWRKALQLASHPEEPKLVFFYDLLEDLLTDGHLQSQIQMRKMSTLNTDFQVINRKTAEIDEENTFLLQQQWFFDFLNLCLDSILFGVTLIEFQRFENEKITISPIPRRNVVPVLGKIYPDATKDDFINYKDDVFKAWLLEIGKANDLGVLNNVIPNLIWKRNVMQSWAEFCEKFGMPLITATTSSNDSEKIDDINEMLLSLGEATVGTFPFGTDIKFQEANRTDAYNVYMQFMQVNDNQISKQLVGSATLSDSNNNRSQTEVHERSLDFKIAQSDKRFIQFVINDQLFPLLRLQGYNLSEDVVFEWKTAEQEIALNDLWNITNGMLMQGYKIDTEWLSKTFNIPVASSPSERKSAEAEYVKGGEEQGKA